MIRLVVLGIALAGVSAHAQVTRDQAQQIAYTFGCTAVNGASSLVTLASLPWADDVPAGQVAGDWCFAPWNALCDVRQSDGKITAFDIDADSHPELQNTYQSTPVLPLSQITDLANGYLASAGWPDTYTAYKVTQQFPEVLGYAKYGLEMHAMRGAAMVLDSIHVDLEPTTGFLMRLVVPGDPPSTPANMTPAITPDAATAVISAYALSAHGISALVDFQPAMLALWRPVASANNPDSFLTSAQVQMGQNNQGMLVYYGSFGEQASYDPDYGSSYCRFQAYVDAQTGALLDMEYTSGWGFGGSASAKKRVHGPLTWDWSPGPTTAFTAKKSAKAPSGDVLSASAPAKAPVGVPFYLTRGRLTLACHFDKASGLVWQTQGAKRVYGKPNKDLLKAILKVTGAPGRRP